VPRARRTCAWTIRSDSGDSTCPLIATAGRYCPAHAILAEKARGTRQQRGYDAKHDALRKRLLPRAYGKPCPLCGKVMDRRDPNGFDLDHTIPLWQDRNSVGDRIVHRKCNQERPKHKTRS
jgi:hypothetical protein